MRYRLIPLKLIQGLPYAVSFDTSEVDIGPTLCGIVSVYRWVLSNSFSTHQEFPF